MRIANPVTYLAIQSVILTKNENREKRTKKSLNYRSVIGVLFFLINSSRREQAYIVHQCARCCNDSNHTHE